MNYRNLNLKIRFVYDGFLRHHSLIIKLINESYLDLYFKMF
jgi:hypothetical protein